MWTLDRTNLLPSLLWLSSDKSTFTTTCSIRNEAAVMVDGSGAVWDPATFKWRPQKVNMIKDRGGYKVFAAEGSPVRRTASPKALPQGYATPEKARFLRAHPPQPHVHFRALAHYGWVVPNNRRRAVDYDLHSHQCWVGGWCCTCVCARASSHARALVTLLSMT